MWEMSLGNDAMWELHVCVWIAGAMTLNALSASLSKGCSYALWDSRANKTTEAQGYFPSFSETCRHCSIWTLWIRERGLCNHALWYVAAGRRVCFQVSCHELMSMNGNRLFMIYCSIYFRAANAMDITLNKEMCSATSYGIQFDCSFG